MEFIFNHSACDIYYWQISEYFDGFRSKYSCFIVGLDMSLLLKYTLRSDVEFTETVNKDLGSDFILLTNLI